MSESDQQPPADVPPPQEGFVSGTHGEVSAGTPEKLVGLVQHKPERKATGLPAVLNSFYYAWSEAGFLRGTLPLLQ